MHKRNYADVGHWVPLMADAPDLALELMDEWFRLAPSWASGLAVPSDAEMDLTVLLVAYADEHHAPIDPAPWLRLAYESQLGRVSEELWTTAFLTLVRFEAHIRLRAWTRRYTHTDVARAVAPQGSGPDKRTVERWCEGAGGEMTCDDMSYIQFIEVIEHVAGLDTSGYKKAAKKFVARMTKRRQVGAN